MSREEGHVVGSLVALCRRMHITCLVDVGCEDAWEAEQIRAATGCRAVGIDADPKCRLASDANVEFHRTLIGATDCTGMTFYVNANVGLSTHYIRDDAHGQEAHLMPQERLDTFCERVGVRPDALIIDTEGSTLDVLEGAAATLANVRLIYAEVQAYAIRPGIRSVREVDALLLPLGFTHHAALPSYNGGAQSNLTYVRPT